jgi:hypothetical protein
MTKEGESAQTPLFTGELVETASPSLSGALPTGENTALATEYEQPTVPSATVGSIHEERETPKATLREVRAVRSLLYNQLLLEVVQRRIEKAETIILSYLLTQGDTEAQIGPYLVVIDAAHHIDVTKTSDDGWYQLYFPEVDSPVMG